MEAFSISPAGPRVGRSIMRHVLHSVKQKWPVRSSLELKGLCTQDYAISRLHVRVIGGVEEIGVYMMLKMLSRLSRDTSAPNAGA